MTEKTAIVKALKRSAAILIATTLLMSGLSLNAVNAADKGRSSGGNLSDNGSQTTDWKQTADKGRSSGGNLSVNGIQTTDWKQTADKNQASGRNRTAGKIQSAVYRDGPFVSVPLFMSV